MPAELWVVEGDGYKLPVIAEEDGQGIYQVDLAPVNFLEKQKTLLFERMTPLSINRVEDTFFMLESSLKTIASKLGLAEGADPEEVLQWNSSKAGVKYEFNNPDAFYESFVDRCNLPGCRTPDQARVLFLWFCLHMQDWLLNKQQPVDLYFCRLHPFPYRADWKNCIFKRDAELPVLYQRGRAIKFPRFIPDMYRRLGEYFYSDEILAINERETGVTWILEVELQEPWEEHAMNLEAKRLEVREQHYWPGVMENLKRRGLDAMKLYAKWLAAIRLKKPSLPLCWDDKRCEFMVGRRVRSQNPRPSALSTVANLKKIGPCIPDNLQAEDKSMYPLPNF